MSQRSRNHHYVPKALQKNFWESQEKIWYAKRSSVKEKFLTVELRNCSSAFKRRDFYTVLDGSDKLSDIAERDFYGIVDDQLGKTLFETIPILDSGNLPLFHGIPLESFKHLITVMFKRTLDMASKQSDDDTGNSIIDGTLKEVGKFHGISIEQAREVIKFPPARHLGRTVRVNAQTSYSENILEALRDYRVAAVSAASGSSFILGSKMIYRISNGTADRLGSENVEIWFPISPRYCLVLHALKNSPNSIITWPQRKVREVNEFIARESLEVGSHSNKLLRSVLAIRQ